MRKPNITTTTDLRVRTRGLRVTIQDIRSLIRKFRIGIPILAMGIPTITPLTTTIKDGLMRRLRLIGTHMSPCARTRTTPAPRRAVTARHSSSPTSDRPRRAGR